MFRKIKSTYLYHCMDQLIKFFCCLVKITKMQNIDQFWKMHNLRNSYPKIRNDLPICSVNNELQVYVILEICIFIFRAVIKIK